MNSADTLRQIHRFLKGKYRKEVDAFCIYQWVDRCYFHGWWDLGAKLGSSIPPNSLNQEYHKRLEYLLSECRSKLKDQFVELKSPKGTRVFSVPKSFWDVCDHLSITPGGSSTRRLRLECLGQKVILIETIKTDKCTFYFSDRSKDQLAEWLDNRRFGYLKPDIRPRRKTRFYRCRLILPWEEASKLIPILCEEAKTSTPLIKALKGLPPEARREIEEILARTLKIEVASTKITDPPWKLDGKTWHLENRCSQKTRDMFTKLDEILQQNFEIDGPKYEQKNYISYRVNGLNWLSVVTTPNFLRLDFLIKTNSFDSKEVSKLLNIAKYGKEETLSEKIGLGGSVFIKNRNKKTDRMYLRIKEDFDLEDEKFLIFLKDTYKASPK